MSYDNLRHLADSWGLMIMVIIYVGLCGWVLRPAARKRNHHAATAIFEDRRHD